MEVQTLKNESPRQRSLFFAIFTISGFSGLIYEAIWSHYLKLFLGHAAYAQTLVLAIFMGGMAIGSWIMAKYSQRLRNLLLGYAIVEGVIGLLGLVFHKTSVAATSWAFDAVLPNLDSPLAAQLFKWSLGALLILPQSVLLGMTFPLMSGAIVRRFPQRAGQTLALLYFTNSLGAAIGVLVSGFVLIGAVGLPGTILTAGILNIVLALLVWGIAKFRPDAESEITPAPVAASTSSSGQSVLRWILIGAAVTGAASFLYEIAWLRMLSLVLGSSTHSFEMMLSAFILGIALGGLWVHRRIDALENPLRFLANILMIMAGVAILSLPIYNETFDVMAQLMRTFSPTQQGYVGISLSSHAIAMLVMIPTTFFCGMTLPVMTHLLIRSGTGERAIGAVYAWNTAGAIVGVILAVHVLMPWVGVKGVVITGAALQLALAVFYRAQEPATESRLNRAFGPAVGAVLVLAGAALFITLDPAKLTSGVYRDGQASVAGIGKVLFLEHGKTATVSLIDVNGSISIATNGKPDAAIRMTGDSASPDEITMVMLGAIPHALHPHPARIAAIGMGSGLTTHVLLAAPGTKEVDTIEIEPVMARAARIAFMPRVSRTFTDPRSHIHFEDAKTFFAMNRKKYDVIVSEPSNPWVSGVATLFSQEFYRQVTGYLEPDGVLVQWLQIYETDFDILQSVLEAMAPEFSDFAVYSADDTNVLIVAVRNGTLSRSTARAFEIPGVRAEMAHVGLMTPQDIESRFLGDKKLLTPFLAHSGVPANSDYFPYVDLHAARARIMERNAIEYVGLQTLPLPLFELLEGNTSSRTSTTPSEKASSARDRLGIEATKIRIALETSDYKDLDPDVARMLLALQSTAAECAEPSVQRTWLASAYYVAAQTTAPLSASELKPLWKAISGTPCAAALSPQSREMLSLFQAVAARDVVQAAAIGVPLFDGHYEFNEPEQFAYAVLATSASAVATNQPGVALELIGKNVKFIAASSTISLAYRWVAAIAYDLQKTNGAPVSPLTPGARPVT